MITPLISTESFLNDFRIFSENTKEQDFIFPLRKEAIEQFAKLGFPTTKNEEWKYTNVTPVAKGSFHYPLQANGSSLTKEDIRNFLISGKEASVLVFENGRFNPSLSKTESHDTRITLRPLASCMNDEAVKQHLGKYASIQTESFIALNTAFVNDGVFIHVPAGVVVEQPIHILHVSDGRKEAIVSYPRNLIVAEKNSRVNVVESFHSLPAANQQFLNCVTEVVVKEYATVEISKIQNELPETFHISHTEASLEANSNFNINTVTLGGSIVRNNLHIVFNGERGTAHLHGLYILDGNQLVDNHTLVDHAKPTCFSNELYKGIIDGKAQGVFNGKIFVRKDAQKTNAYQSNKNILMSDDASMNAKPQLEIFADDVKCSHGATTGQLDDDALFYLRSRGISEENSKALLNVAFAADVIKNISIEPLRNNLSVLISAKLKKS